MKSGLVKMAATFFGVGYSPWASGTLGSLAGVLVAWFVGPASCTYLLFFALLGFIISKPAATLFVSTDPSQFVLDEVVGMMIAVFLLPKSLAVYSAAFVIFRLFDIAKPWPISLIQKSKHPWAIMWDDIAAGIFTCALVHGYLFLRQ